LEVKVVEAVDRSASDAMLLLRKYEISYLNYTFAIVNALIIAKIILIGEWARLGRKVEAKPLYLAVLYKSFVFGLLVFGFHFLKEFISASSTAFLPALSCATPTSTI
jgi:hypothetical protein